MDEDSFVDFDHPFEVNLCEEENPLEHEKQGGFKSYTTKGDGEVVYESGRESDFSIMVERLLCVDGWENTEKEPPQAMTLLVLEFTLACTDPDGRFESMTTTIEFEDRGRSKNEAKPEVDGWAPFMHMQRYNESEAEMHHKSTLGAEVGGGAAGATATVNAGLENEITSNRKYFDEGNAYPVFSKIDERRNGVTWFLKQNSIQKAGISPEFRVAILLKRASQAPFLCKFRIRTRAGMWNDFVDGIKRVFRANPGSTKPFLMTPATAARVRYEGKEILESIDTENLGKLKKKQLQALSIVWGCNPVVQNK